MNSENKTKNRIPSPVRSEKVAKVPMIMQMEALECGAACLDMVLSYYGRFVPLSQLRKECDVSRDGSNLNRMIAVARYYGLDAHAYRISTEELKAEAVCPCILFWNNNHWIVLDGYKNGRFIINDPSNGIQKLNKEEFDKHYSGICAVFEPTGDFEPGGTKESVFGYLRSSLVGAFPMIMLVLITSLIIALIGIIEPIAPRVFLDYLITGSVASAWNKIFFSGLILIVVIRVVLLWIKSSYLLKMEGKMAIYNSTKYVWHILSLPMDFFSQRYASDITNRGFSNEHISMMIIMDYVPLALDFASMLFYLIMMISYSPLLAGIGVFSVILNVIVTFIISDDTSNLMRAKLNIDAELANTETDGIQMIETIKSSGSETSFFQKWAGQYAEANHEMVEINAIDTAYGMIPTLLTQLISGLILCLSVAFVISGEWTIGIVSTFAAYLNNFTAPTSNLIDSISSFKMLSTQIERVKDVMEYERDPIFENPTVEIPEKYSKLSGKIELSHVTFGYNKLKDPLIRDFNMTIKPGDSVAFVGSSGSGKSTLIKLMTNLNKPWEGKILFDGKLIDEIDRDVFVASIAVVDQSITIFPDTVYNNITMWDRSIDYNAIVMAARTAGIYDDIIMCENGFETFMTEGGKNFSGGQRQRIEITRALATEPSILIMDEATSALDAETEYKILSGIREKGITTITVSHRLSTIRNCDCIIVLKNGEVLDRGTHQELMERCKYYADMISNE